MSIILGELKTYGALTGVAGTDYLVFSGSGALSNVRSAWPQRWSGRYVNPLVMAEGQFPVDTAGYSPVPYAEPPIIVYEYLFLAPPSYTDGQSFKYVSQQMNKIRNFFLGSYTLDGVSGTSGMKGWLQVRDEDPATSTTYKCKARVLADPEFELIKGQPDVLSITLTFGPTGEFAAV